MNIWNSVLCKMCKGCCLERLAPGVIFTKASEIIIFCDGSDIPCQVSLLGLLAKIKV